MVEHDVWFFTLLAAPVVLCRLINFVDILVLSCAIFLFLVLQSGRWYSFFFFTDRYGYILDILQGREDLKEKIKECVVDSGGGQPLIPRFSLLWLVEFNDYLIILRIQMKI